MRNKIKTYSFILALVFSLASFAPVLAQTNTDTGSNTGRTNTDTTNKTPPTRTNTTDKTRMMDEAAAKKRAAAEETRKQKLMETRKRTIKNMMNNHITRLTRAISRMDSILKRIEARKAKMNDVGINTSSLDSLIARANSQQTEAENMLAEIQTQYDAIDSAEDFKVAAQEFMDSVKELQQHLQTMHGTLKDIIKAMTRLDKAAAAARKDNNEETSANENE